MIWSPEKGKEESGTELKQISKQSFWLACRLLQSEPIGRRWSMNLTTKLVPPEARRSASDAPWHVSISHGLWASAGGLRWECGSVACWAISRGQSPRKSGGCEVWSDKVTAAGGEGQWLPDGIWAGSLHDCTKELLPHRDCWVILGKMKVVFDKQAYSKVRAAPGSRHYLVHLWI